jgi:hypothetical protein
MSAPTILDMPLDTLGTMPTRVINALEKGDITKVGDLVQRTEQEVGQTPGLGKAGVLHLKHLLYLKGLTYAASSHRNGTLPIPFPSMHERLTRIEQRLDRLEGHSLLREVGDMSGHVKPGEI